MEKENRLTEEVIKEIRSQYKVLRNQKMQEREHKLEEYSNRNVFHRDYTRILYSSSFRRLQGKMQIFGIESTAFYRNRLTHSLEVAQIAHSIAKNICEQCSTNDEPIYTDEDIFVIDAAALAHVYTCVYENALFWLINKKLWLTMAITPDFLIFQCRIELF